MMEYQVPSSISDIHLISVDRLFKDASTREVEYHAAKDLALCQGILIAAIRDPKNQNKTLLHIAAGFGRKSWVRGLITDGADVNSQDDEGQTPLHAACNHAHRTVSSILIETGADVNIADNKGWTALHFALSRKENISGIQPHYWEVVELLLTYGADPYLKSLTGKSSFNRIRDPEQRRNVRLKHLLRLLNSNTDDDDKKDCDSSRDLKLFHTTHIRLIEKYLKINDFFELIKIGDETIDIIRQLLIPRLLHMRLEACDNITPLHRAAGYNHCEVLKLLIDCGADVNATDAHGRIPLHNAAKYGHIESIEYLIEYGSEIDKQDLEGYSPIHVAASNGTYTACLRLIELGANKHIRSISGELAYDLAESDDVKEVLTPDKVRMVPSTSEQAVYIGFQEEDEINMTSTAIEPNQTQAHFITNLDNLMLDSNSDERLLPSPNLQLNSEPPRQNYRAKKVTLTENNYKYQLIKKRMLETIVCHASEIGGRFSNYEILKIEHILHEKVWFKYRLACQRLEIDYGKGSKNEKLLFHGSNFIFKIQAYGFDERYAQRNGMFGAGLYFAAHSSKSNQYTFGFGQGCKEHHDKSCYECERTIIYAQVALGRSLISKEAIPDCAHAPPGYSSVTGLPEATDGLIYPEYVIYNGDQAYPLFVITYKIKP